MSIKTIFAVWIGKTITKVLKLFGSGATSLPGKIVIKICPDILGRLAKNVKIICVTGTNGKTTTCHVIRDMLIANGNTVFSNEAGANLLSGIVSVFVKGVTLSGTMKSDYVLLECDEASLKSIVKDFDNLDVTVVVTNIFRDQSDRYAEVTNTLDKIREALLQLPNVKLVLNADCSITSSLADVPCKEISYFGIDAPLYDEITEEKCEAAYCLRCQHKYQYHYHTFGHLGGFYCEKCGYQRQNPQVSIKKVEEWKAASTIVTMDVFGKEMTVEVMLKGGYNLYNALAATLVGRNIGLSEEKIKEVLSSLTSHFGRMEEVQLGESTVEFMLVKNPTGFNETIQFLIGQNPTGTIVFGLNDHYADGTDISWIYDVDFERFAETAKGVRHFYFTGTRARDMQVRLKYAEFDTEKFSVEKDYKTLLTKIQQSKEKTYLILSYTCMLEMREKLGELVPLKKFEN